jgi:hypothetical protein
MFKTKVTELIIKNTFHGKQDFDTTNNYSEIALSLPKQRGKKGPGIVIKIVLNLDFSGTSDKPDQIPLYDGIKGFYAFSNISCSKNSRGHRVRKLDMFPSTWKG